MRKETSNSQQLSCPQQRVEYKCQITVPTTALTWTIPTGVVLEFGSLRNVGDVRNTSDNVYSATLTEKTEDDDPNTERFFFTSTLLVLQPVNVSNLTCDGSNVETESTTITLSGKHYRKKHPTTDGGVYIMTQAVVCCLSLFLFVYLTICTFLWRFIFATNIKVKGHMYKFISE